MCWVNQKKAFCLCSIVVVRLIRNQKVMGSIPIRGFFWLCPVIRTKNQEVLQNSAGRWDDLWADDQWAAKTRNCGFSHGKSLRPGQGCCERKGGLELGEWTNARSGKVWCVVVGVKLVKHCRGCGLKFMEFHLCILLLSLFTDIVCLTMDAMWLNVERSVPNTRIWYFSALFTREMESAEPQFFDKTFTTREIHL